MGMNANCKPPCKFQSAVGLYITVVRNYEDVSDELRLQWV